MHIFIVIGTHHIVTIKRLAARKGVKYLNLNVKTRREAVP
jgi:hypothetical protein